jgi:acetyl-CoA carboxylase biotin carboxyl carrier protein
MDLTNEDVADVLAVLDSLPYDELDLQTPRFRLILQRTRDGWTQSVEARSEPSVLEPVPEGSHGVRDPQAPSSGAGGTHTPTGDAGPGDSHGVRDPQAPSSGAGGTHTPIGGTGAADGAGADAGDAGRELVAVRAPLPGTFYRAPRPGAAPFVEVGSRVGTDTVVGIVETMKLMNSVTAGVDGEVAEVCLGNAEFAAHGATLLRIRAD